MTEKEGGWLKEEKPAGRSPLVGGAAGLEGRAEPLPFHEGTEANLHDEIPHHSTAPEKEDREGRL